MRDEIAAGMRNALEKGEPLEKVVQSFINAGYNPFEVRAVSQIFSGYGSSSAVVHSEQFPDAPQPPAQNQTQELQVAQIEKKKSKKVLIIGIFVAALIVLGAISYLIYTILK